MKSHTCSYMSSGIDRAVTKISPCRENTTSRWGIKQLGIYFGSIFFYFPLKVATFLVAGENPSPQPLNDRPGLGMG